MNRPLPLKIPGQAATGSECAPGPDGAARIIPIRPSWPTPAEQ